MDLPPLKTSTLLLENPTYFLKKTLTLIKGFRFVFKKSKPYLEFLPKNNNNKEITLEVIQKIENCPTLVGTSLIMLPIFTTNKLPWYIKINIPTQH